MGKVSLRQNFDPLVKKLVCMMGCLVSFQDVRQCDLNGGNKGGYSFVYSCELFELLLKRQLTGRFCHFRQGTRVRLVVLNFALRDTVDTRAWTQKQKKDTTLSVKIRAVSLMDDPLPTRWEVELEFIQSLANIQYLNHLAQNNFLQDPKFLRYLDYLNYWREPQYARHLVYPNCLHILKLLQNEEFRRNIVSPDFMSTVMNDMVKRWQITDTSETTPAEDQ